MTTGAAALAGALLTLAVLVRPPRWGSVDAARGQSPWGSVLGAGLPGRRRRRGAPGRLAARAGRWRGRRRAGDPDLVALLDLLVPALRAGLPVALALGGDWEGVGEVDRGGDLDDQATGPSGWVASLTDQLRVEAACGRPLAPVWAVHSAAAGSTEGGFVARAWELSETLGAPLAESVAEAASAVRARIARSQRLEVAVAGPRATARILTLLPLVGPLVATAMGISLPQLYSGVGSVCVLAGLLLLLLGRAWCARLLRSVSRPLTAAELP
ncbi:hypothetical protein V3N99_13650 [Dermatophilaceae bacterium Soc4.6]